MVSWNRWDTVKPWHGLFLGSWPQESPHCCLSYPHGPWSLTKLTGFAVVLAVFPLWCCCGNVHPAATSIYHYHIAIASRSLDKSLILYTILKIIIMHAIRTVKSSSPFPPLGFHPLHETMTGIQRVLLSSAEFCCEVHSVQEGDVLELRMESMTSSGQAKGRAGKGRPRGGQGVKGGSCEAIGVEPKCRTKETWRF